MTGETFNWIVGAFAAGFLLAQFIWQREVGKAADSLERMADEARERLR